MKSDKREEHLIEMMFNSVQSMTEDELEAAYASQDLNIDEQVSKFNNMLETATLTQRKQKLKNARQQMEQKRTQSASTTEFVKKLKSRGEDVKTFLVMMMARGEMPGDLTVAFRDGKDISDEEAEGILEDLINLGLVKGDEQ